MLCTDRWRENVIAARRFLLISYQFVRTTPELIQWTLPERAPLPVYYRVFC